MAVTLEEFELKLKSEIAAAGSKDVAALQKVDAAVKAAQGSLAGLQAQAKAAVAARDAAAAKLSEATGGAGGKVDIGAVRRAQAALAAAQGAVDTSTAKAAAGQQNVDALQAARPRLEALALEKNKIRETARENAAAAREAQRVSKEASSAAAREAKQQAAKDARAAKDAAREKARAQKDAERAAKESAEKFKEQQEAASKASFAFKGAVVEVGAEVVKYAAILFAAATVALTVFVIKVADAARSLRILGAALTGNERLGDEFAAVVKQLAEVVPLAKDQIISLAKDLELMRLGRRDMQAGLTAIAVVTSALGDSAGSAIKSIVQTTAATRRFSLGARDAFGEFTALAGTGLKKADVLGALAKQLGKSLPEVERMLQLGQVSVKDGLRALEAAAEARFGKTIAAQMLSLDVQFQKAKENVETLFAGVNIEPVLEGLKTVLSVLDHNTATGRALQVVLTAAFTALGSVISTVAPMLKAMFQGALIMALRLYIGLRPVARAFMAIGEAVGGVIGWLAKGLGIDALEAGKIAAFALAAAFGLVGVAILVAFIPLIVLGTLVAAAVYVAYKAVDAFLAQIDALGEFVRSIDLGAAAANLIQGLANGIMSNAGAVLDAMSNLANGAIDAFKAKLGIHSPSVVFATLGGHIATGAAQGVEGGTAEVADAAREMGGAAVGGAEAGAGAAQGGGGGPRAVVPIYLFPGGPFLRNLIVSVVNGEIDVMIDGGGAGYAPGV